jgi:hypothetical protein
MHAEVYSDSTLEPGIYIYPDLWQHWEDEQISPVKVVPEAAETEVPAQQFRGRLEITGLKALWPEQRFTVQHPALDQAIIEGENVYPWPHIKIDLVIDSKGRRKAVRGVHINPADNTIDAEIFYTRFVFALVQDGFCRVMDFTNNTELKLKVHANEDAWFFRRANLIRKLKFIEEALDVHFRLPEVSNSEDVRFTEMVFRALTEGQFVMRHHTMNFPDFPLSQVRLNEPPFGAPGEFGGAFTEGITLLNQTLDLGPYALVLKCAEVFNWYRLERWVKERRQTADLSFVLLDRQAHYIFPDYMEKREEMQTRLQEFKERLLRNEPQELVDLLTTSTQKPVSEDEAKQIVIGWLQFHDFPDRFWPTVPTLEEKRWRVPICIIYPGGRHGVVEEALVDLETGELEVPTSVEDILKRGKTVADNLSRAS